MRQATYFTSSDSRFFPGTVALINSLRLTGHEGEIVVIDLGLTKEQRQRLSRVATLESPVRARDGSSKALPAPARSRDPIVVIDSDMIVVASLNGMLDQAKRGKISLFPDPYERWFSEWSTGFALQAPLRHGQRYANGGLVAFSVECWPQLLERWAQANSRLPRTRAPWSHDDPFAAVDQDALNALLMSEFPADAVSLEPIWEEAHADEMVRVRVVNASNLTCTDGVKILHHSLRPKVWEATGWQRDFRQAYIRLLPRVLYGHDVPLQLEPYELPLWLRPSVLGRSAAHGLAAVRRVPWATHVAKGALRATRSLSLSVFHSPSGHSSGHSS
jgi:hypothetical protein